MHRRIQKIHLTVHYLVGFASIFPFKAERFEWIDALVEYPQHFVPTVFAKIGGMRPSFRIPKGHSFVEDTPRERFPIIRLWPGADRVCSEIAPVVRLFGSKNSLHHP